MSAWGVFKQKFGQIVGNIQYSVTALHSDSRVCALSSSKVPKMVNFVDYLSALSVKQVLKMYMSGLFTSQDVLREVRDRVMTRIVRGEHIDAEDRASYFMLQIHVMLQGTSYLINYYYYFHCK